MQTIDNRMVKNITTGNFVERVFTPPYIAMDNIGGRMYDWVYLEMHKPAWYMGVAYKEWVSHDTVYYPIPLNLFIRLLRWLKWCMLDIFYWVGLVNVGAGERYTWDSFFRIKNHH